MAASTADRLRRLIYGAGLIGAPLAFFLGTVVHPGLRRDHVEQVALIGAHREAWYWTHVLGFVAVILFIPAILALARILREHTPGASLAGACLCLAGFVGWGGVVTFFGFVGWQMTAAGDQAQMADLFRRLNEAPGSVVPLRVLSFGVVGGMMTFAVALARSRVVPRWIPALLAPGFGLFAVGGLAAQVWLLTLGTAAMTLALGAVGVRVLRNDVAVL